MSREYEQLRVQIQDFARSPVVNADRTVTLVFNAPGANSVSAVGGFPGAPSAMTRDDAGIWRTTLGPNELMPLIDKDYRTQTTSR